MEYTLKAGALYLHDRMLARIKNCFSGPEKRIVSADGDLLLQTEIRAGQDPRRAPGDVRQRRYSLVDAAGKEIAQAQPDYAAGDEPGYDHGRSGAQVAGRDARALEGVHAVYRGDAPVHLDVRAELPELGHVLEAVVVYALGYDAPAPGEGERRGELRLHIRREAGIGHGLYADGAHPAAAAHDDGVLVGDDGDAHLAQLRADAL